MKVKTKSSQKTHANGVEIEEIDNFKYLGSYIPTNGSIDMEISTRLAMAAQAFNKLGGNIEVILSASKNKALQV